MRARVVLIGSVAVAAIGGVLNGCGRLPIFADAGSVATGGSTTAGGTMGTAGTSGGGGASGGGNTAGGGGSAGSGTGGGSGGANTPGSAEPACAPSVQRSLPCGPTDQQLCYKTCGPENAGVKKVTCGTTPQTPPNSTVFIEMAGCVFDPVADYSCYRLPTGANAACPAGVTPMDSMDCGTVPYCVLCNSFGGLPGGFYDDSRSSTKTGYCVCQLPNVAGLRTWSCASDTSWPCPGGSGC